MRVRLDTHASLWFVAGDSQISRLARQIIESTSNEVLVSMGSFWENAIKYSAKKLEIEGKFLELLLEDMTQHHFDFLPIDLEALSLVATLPFHHRDPFDRLLNAQAIAQNLPIVTRDPAFAAYPVELIW